MYNQRVIDVRQLPVSFEKRKYTDVICIWFHFLFVLTIFGFAIFHFSQSNSIQQSSSTAGRKGSCPEVYQSFWSQQNPDIRMCVEACPSNYQNLDRVCYPIDSKQLSRYLQYSPFKQQWNESNFSNMLLMMIIFVSSLSVAFLTFSYFFSRIFQRFLMIFAILVIFGLLAINILGKPQLFSIYFQDFNQQTSIIFLCIFGLLVLILLAWLIAFNKELSWNGLMMDCASKILPQKLSFISFIFRYYFGLLVVLGIFVFQLYAFSHKQNEEFSWTIQPSFSVLQIFSIFELLWNLQYIKDTFYFSLSNFAVSSYYFYQIDFCTNISLSWVHSGSLSGGSFVNTIFYIPNCLLDAICCFPQERRQNCGLCFTSLTGLARTDAYAYQLLSGIPFCNASRQCRKIGNQTKLWVGANSSLSSFRFFLHSFLNLACLFFGFVIMKNQQIEITLWRIFEIFMITESLMSGLIDIITILAESVQTCLLVDAAISNQNQSIYGKSRFCEVELKDYLQDNQNALRPFFD